jgi:DNA-binding GntR family transcriptional regulator
VESASSIVPLQHVSKEQAIYDQVRRAISMGIFAPGQRLLPNELARQYHVSSMPVRNALMRLEAEHLVTRAPHRAYVVTEYSPTEIRNLYAIRANLEGMAARLGARRFPADQVPVLHRILMRAEQHLLRGEVGALMAANTEFHDLIYQHADNEQLLQLIFSLRDRADRYRAMYAGIEEIQANTLAEHREIVTALLAGQADAVGTIIEKYTEKTADTLQHLVTGPEQTDATADRLAERVPAGTRAS